MQVILLEKVANLGNLGDVVKVRDGYGRNYLIPQRKARTATPQALAEFQARRAELEKAAAERLAAAQDMASRLDGLTVQLVQKAGVDGRLFGSVTTQDIVAGLAKAGFDLSRSMVRLPQGPLKTVGDHSVELALATDVSVHVTVSVLGEQA